MKRIGCVGDNCVDHYRQTGEDHFGGNPVNVAVYTRRLGGDISYVGAVGTDGRGAALLDALRRRGVDVSHVHVDEGSTAVTYVEHINGDRVFGNYDEGVMARFALTEEDIAFLGGHALVVSGLWGHAEGYLARIRQAGAVTAFDCSDRPEDPAAQTALPCTDIAFFSDDGSDDEALRQRLRQLAEREGNDALWRRLEAMDPETAKRIHPNNVGRVIRAIEVMTVSGKSIREHEAESLREPCPYHVIELGLRYHDRETLYGRINRRVDKMVEMGLTEEVKAAREQGLTATAAQAIGCKELYSWLDGKETQEEALEKLKQSTRRYAKRQLTWFGTDQRMRWIEPDTLAAGETPLDKAMEILEKEEMA